VELFRKKDSRFYWYDFKLRGKRYRRSTKETNKRAGKIAALSVCALQVGILATPETKDQNQKERGAVVNV
jgi:hypothetical protein